MTWQNSKLYENMTFNISPSLKLLHIEDYFSVEINGHSKQQFILLFNEESIHFFSSVYIFKL